MGDRRIHSISVSLSSMPTNSILRASAIFGFIAVALGAFGAHGFHQTLLANETLEIWKTAAFYHLVHSAVLAAIGLTGGVQKSAAWCFGAGIVIFSGSLYILALTNIKWLGAITPVGGLAFLAGWLLLGFAKGRK